MAFKRNKGKVKVASFITLLAAVFLLGAGLFSTELQANERTVDYMEGHALWVDFLDAVSHIEHVEEWYINSFGSHIFQDGYLIQMVPRNFFTNFLSYGNLNEWYDIPLFQRFIWYNVFVQPASRIRSNTDPELASIRNQLFTGEGNLQGFLVGLQSVGSFSFRNMLDNFGVDGATQIFDDLMTWQFNHIMATGAAFDFTTGLKNTVFLQPNIEPIEVEPPHRALFGFNPTRDVADLDPDDVDIPDDALDGVLGVLDGAGNVMDAVGDAFASLAQTDPNRGIWDDILGFFGDYIITLIILGVLLVALAVVVLIRRSRMSK